MQDSTLNVNAKLVFTVQNYLHITTVQFNIHKKLNSHVKCNAKHLICDSLSKLSGCFWLYALKFCEVVEVYEWYFVIP